MTREKMIQWAISELKRGLLPSVLAGHIMVKFQVTAGKARAIAEKAMKAQKESK